MSSELGIFMLGWLMMDVRYLCLQAGFSFPQLILGFLFPLLIFCFILALSIAFEVHINSTMSLLLQFITENLMSVFGSDIFLSLRAVFS